MHAITRRLATAGSALALAASSLLLASSPASAATSCYASSCEGLDPAATICQNDARTVRANADWGVELRYSPTCRTAWARYTNGMAFDFTLYVERQNPDGTFSPSYSIPYHADGSVVWTRMVNDAGHVARACARGSFTVCTGGY